MKKVVSILLTLCIINLNFGCASSRVISYDDTWRYYAEKEYVILHAPQKTYAVHNYEFSDDSLTGKLMKYNAKKGYFLHVYTQMNIDLRLSENSGYPLKLPKDLIEKIALKKTKPGSIFLFLGIALGAAILSGIFVGWDPDYSFAL